MALPPGIGPAAGTNQFIQQSKQEVKQDLREARLLMKELIQDLKTLQSDDLAAFSAKFGKQDALADSAASVRQQMADPNALQKETGKPIQLQPQQQAQMDQGRNQSAEVNAAAMAALDDDSTVKEKKKKKLSFEQKMELLSQLEGDLKDVEFDDPEQQQILTEFFDNMDRMKQLQGKINQLTNMRQKYEEILEKQDENEDFHRDHQPEKKQDKSKIVQRLPGGHNLKIEVVEVPHNIEDISHQDQDNDDDQDQDDECDEVEDEQEE